MGNSNVLRLGGGLLVSLLAITGAIIAGSWIFGQAHHRAGLGQSAPEPDSVPASHHHQTPPGR
jgi:hypothetical protein